MYFLDNCVIDNFTVKIEKLKTLIPSPEVNVFFEELCNFCMAHEKKVLQDAKVSKLQNTCSAAECLLEKNIAENIISSENPWETVKTFLYFQNYEDLTKLEYLNISFYSELKSILFLGGGSLPLTAILLAKNYDIECTIIDYDVEAVNFGKKLIEKLGLQGKMRYIVGNAYEYTDTKKYDVCYVAALVWGDVHTQKKLLAHLRDTINTNYFLIRSSHGTRELLYKKVSLPLLREYLQIEHIIHPKNHIINSIVITKKYEK